MGQCLEGRPHQPLMVFFPALWACRSLPFPASAASRLAPLSRQPYVTFVKSFVLDGQDDFAEMLPTFQITLRRARLRERKGPIYHYMEFFLFDKVKK